MHFNLHMPKDLKNHFKQEIEQYRQALALGQLAKAWHHLERAHVLGQSFPAEHSYVHWKMLQFGIKIKSGKEVRGQLIRLLVGGVKSFVGKVPLGNTGGANVPPLLPMEIAPDLQGMLQLAGKIKKPG